MGSWASPTGGSRAAAKPGMLLGGRYELDHPIAAGGMAQVWAGDDILLDRRVAIKILHPHLSDDDGFVERFRREAVAAASLSHESIVAVFDTVSENDVEAIVMELIDGGTLRAKLDEVGAMPAAEVLHVATAIASALDVAHSAGIVHRDIKPANIMLCVDGRVMVTDFGIAKAGTDADLTQTGTLLGTAKYLAPEQVTGAPMDPRSDLYALGVLMFEALTGNVPFKANTDAATALARLHQDPPRLRSIRPNVSIELSDIVHRLMDRDPNRRYARASLLVDALRLVTSATGDPTASVDATNTDLHRPVPPPPPGSGQTPAVTGAPSGPRSGPTPAVTHPPSGPTPSGPVPASPGPRSGRFEPDDLSSYPPPVAKPDSAAPFSGSSNRSPATTGPAPISGETGAVPPGETDPPTPSWQRDGYEVIGVDPPGGGVSTLSEGRVTRSGRSRIVPLLVIAAIAALLTAGLLLTDLGSMMGLVPSDEVNPLDESGPGLILVGATSFDPLTNDDDKSENEELTGRAIDGDPATAWVTETYRAARLSDSKEGVGILIQLEEALPLNRIELDTNTTGWVAELYVGSEFAADGSNWGEAVATVEAGSNRVVRDLGRNEGDTVLLWLRDTGITSDRFRFELAEVTIR